MIPESYFHREFDNICQSNGLDVADTKRDVTYSKIKYFETEDLTKALEWLRSQEYFKLPKFMQQLFNAKAERIEREKTDKENKDHKNWWAIVQKNKEHGCDNDHQCIGCPANDPENITCHTVLDSCAKGLADILNHRRTAIEVETESMQLFGF